MERECIGCKIDPVVGSSPNLPTHCACKGDTKSIAGIASIHLYYLSLPLQARYRFEGESFPSIRELLEYYRDSQIAVTRRTPAVINNPVSKVRQEGEKWSLRHDDIELGKQLGKGTYCVPCSAAALLSYTQGDGYGYGFVYHIIALPRV